MGTDQNTLRRPSPSVMSVFPVGQGPTPQAVMAPLSPQHPRRRMSRAFSVNLKEC
jgi:hypothetical protein